MSLDARIVGMREAPLYRKVALVRAVPIPEVFTVETREGTMTGQPGDMLCEGADGERWPIKRAIFERTYVPADLGEPETLRFRREQAQNVVLSEGRLVSLQGIETSFTMMDSRGWLAMRAYIASLEEEVERLRQGRPLASPARIDALRAKVGRSS